MIVTRKLIRNGSSICVTLPRSYLHHTGWILGREIVVELLEDSTILLRIPTARDWASRSADPRISAAPPVDVR